MGGPIGVAGVSIPAPLSAGVPSDEVRSPAGKCAHRRQALLRRDLAGRGQEQRCRCQTSLAGGAPFPGTKGSLATWPPVLNCAPAA